MGEEDDTVDGCAANMRGPAGSGYGRSKRGARVSNARGWSLGWPCELGGLAWPAAARANWAGWLLLRASGPSRPGLRGPLPHFLFLFSFSSSLI